MFEFLQPSTLQDAVRMLGETRNVKILGGGTDLIIGLKNKTITCDYVLDCKAIPELQTLQINGGDLEIGAGVSLNRLLQTALPECFDVLKQGAGELANVLLRSRATLAGNICNASPGGDMLPPSLVLGGVVHAVSPRGERSVALKDFFTGVKKHVLSADELVIKTTFPLRKGKGAYLKKKRIRGHDLAQVGVAGFYGDDGSLCMAFGAVGPTPVFIDFGRLTKAELAARKGELVAKALGSVSPIGDVRSSKEYRVAMTEYFAWQILDKFAEV